MWAATPRPIPIVFFLSGHWDMAAAVRTEVRACPILPDGEAMEFGRALGAARRTISADRPSCAARIQP
jgi:hypothetical protein